MAKMVNQVRVNLGSKSDSVMANIFLGLLHDLKVRYGVSIGSCHWLAGKEFDEHISNFNEEKILVVIGGMSLAAPGIISALDRNTRRTGRIVIAVPLDKAAQSAIEDLPEGTPVLTCGYNRVDVRASIKNAALAVANLVANDDSNVWHNLRQWYEEKREAKKAVPEVALNKEGLIP